MDSVLERISQSSQQTQAYGQHLGAVLQAGDVVCLDGDLGMGKTQFCIGVGQGWGAIQPMTSPTFVIVHQHERPADAVLLYHLDAYRLTTPEDADSIGLDDILSGEHVVLIEWAGNIRAELPADALWITLDLGATDDQRILTLSGTGSRSAQLVEILRGVRLVAGN